MDCIGKTIEKRDGTLWRIIGGAVTSDGFLIATIVLLDDDGEEAKDESGFSVLHSAFLGSVNA